METLFIYIIKINFAIALFYGFYRLLFYSNTYFLLRRLLLMGLLLFSFTYPIINLNEWLLEKENVAQAIIPYLENYALNEIEVTPSTPIITPQIIFLGIFLVGTVLFVCKLIMQLCSIAFLYKKGKQITINGHNVITINEEITPFSFFNLIFLNHKQHNTGELEQILKHEETHAQQWHSLDVLFCELATLVCWFNPFIWLFKREVRLNLEYLADKQVILSGYEASAYQYHLLRLTYKPMASNIVNNFNVSQFKQRIKMMNSKKSSEKTFFKISVLIPLIMFLLVCGNAEAIVSLAKEKGSAMLDQVVVVGYTDEPVIAKNESAQTQQQNDDDVFVVVEQMPSFPGGDKALMDYLLKNMRYPSDARSATQQGRVVVSFVVGKTGKINGVKVVRSISPSLDAEAIRIVKSMPLWEPGKQKGVAVAVKYTLPIAFMLTPSSGETNTKAPLIIIDGVEQPVGFDLKTIDAATIDAVNVLKSEEGIKEYKEKGKDGVVLITLKKK